MLLDEYRLHLLNTLGSENMDMERYQRELATLPAPYEMLLVALAGEEAAGCVLVKRIEGTEESIASERACELKRLWVRPQFRGMNIGRILTEGAMAEAKRRGYTSMYLDTVPEEMQAAHYIYRGLGFEPIERYNDNPVRHVTFFRKIL